MIDLETDCSRAWSHWSVAWREKFLIYIRRLQQGQIGVYGKVQNVEWEAEGPSRVEDWQGFSKCPFRSTQDAEPERLDFIELAC